MLFSLPCVPFLSFRAVDMESPANSCYPVVSRDPVASILSRPRPEGRMPLSIL